MKRKAKRHVSYSRDGRDARQSRVGGSLVGDWGFLTKGAQWMCSGFGSPRCLDWPVSFKSISVVAEWPADRSGRGPAYVQDSGGTEAPSD